MLRPHSHPEYVSQWLDGEGSARELREGARLLARNEEDRARLERYRLIGEVLRGEVRVCPEVDMARDVQRSIAGTQPVSAPWWLRWSRPWLLPARPLLAGGALAALALLAVGINQSGLLGPPFGSTVAEEANSVLTEPPSWMQEYLAAHAEYAAAPLTLPYAQLVDYEE